MSGGVQTVERSLWDSGQDAVVMVVAGPADAVRPSHARHVEQLNSMLRTLGTEDPATGSAEKIQVFVLI